MNKGIGAPENHQSEARSEIHREAPWTARDIWLGLGAFGLWIIIALGFGVGREAFSWKMDIGVFIAFWELVLLLPAWWFSVRKYHLSWDALGLRAFDFETIAIGCGLMILAFCFNFFYSLAASLLNLNTQMDITGLFDMVSTPWPLLVAGVLVAPFVEEVFFRGFVFAGFRVKCGWIPAAVISAGLFAVVHMQPTLMLPIFLMGLIFAYLYQRTNSIWPAVIMHLATNTLGLGAAFLVHQFSLSV